MLTHSLGAFKAEWQPTAPGDSGLAMEPDKVNKDRLARIEELEKRLITSEAWIRFLGERLGRLESNSNSDKSDPSTREPPASAARLARSYVRERVHQRLPAVACWA